MTTTLGEIICLHCETALALSNKGKGALALICVHCGHVYPLLDGRIPLLLEDAETYAAGMAVQYERHLAEQEQLRQQWLQASERGSSRAHYLLALVAANAHNASYLSTVRAALLRQVPAPALLRAAVQSQFVRYSTNWNYLRRDWCWLAEGETELTTILAALTAGGAFNASQTIMVAGAATARIAWMLRQYVRHVYALDISLTMAWQFYDLLAKGELAFYDIQPKNCRTTANALTYRTATVQPPSPAKALIAPPEGAFSYFIADVRRVPLPSHSLDAVVAVYFTDTLPLRQLLPEVRRLLKPGGRYVHFGPLEYHFDDVAEMLTAEEVKQEFIAHGFYIEQECEIPSHHLNAAESLAARAYQNWCFTAVAKPLNLTPEDIIYLHQPLPYSIQGELSTGADTTKQTQLYGPDGSVYAGASTVLNLLRFVDGRRSAHAVIADFIAAHDFDAQTDMLPLWQVVETLHQDGIIRAFHPPTSD